MLLSRHQNAEENRDIKIINSCFKMWQNLLSFRQLSKNIKIRMYETMILPVVLYGCDTFSLTLREEHRLRVFENRVLNRISGPSRDEVTRSWRKLHMEELHNSSPNIIRMIKSMRMRSAAHVARMGRRECI
jgi:hypothetical protein